MSFIVSNAVWEHSRQRSGALVVLLKLADYANDDGVSWPAISTLAKHARMSKRHVQRCLEKLQRDRELRVVQNRGRKGSNLYKICLPPIGSERGDAGVSPDIAVAAPVTPMSSNKDVSVTQSVNESSIEPTPIVPKGDDKEFWIKICFNCFNQSPHILSGYMEDKLSRMIPSLNKAHAGSLLEFYKYVQFDPKPPPPYSSRKHSPERLILDLPRQLGLAIRACPPKKEEPPRWREFFQWEYDNPDVHLPKSFYELDPDQRKEYQDGFQEFAVATATTQS
jgi:hypothetical protein